MEVKNIMRGLTKISFGASVSSAAKIMNRKNRGTILIEKNGKIIGIITERDLLRKIVAKDRDPKEVHVEDIMSKPLITIDSEKSITEAEDLMNKNKIRALPVKRNGKIMGIVHMRDISKGLRYSLGKLIIGNNFYRKRY